MCVFVIRILRTINGGVVAGGEGGMPTLNFVGKCSP